MERDELQQLVDGVMAVLSTSDDSCVRIVLASHEEVAPLATALGDVLEMDVSEIVLGAESKGAVYARMAFAHSRGEWTHVGDARVSIRGSSPSNREEWIAYQTELLNSAQKVAS